MKLSKLDFRQKMKWEMKKICQKVQNPKISKNNKKKDSTLQKKEKQQKNKKL